MLDIYVEPAHAVLLLDGRQVAAKGLWLNVGDYRLRASARGFHASERDLHVNGDKPQQLKISLVPVEPRREAAATAAGGWQRPLGWVAATASLIGAAAGVVVAAQRASTLQARTEICPSGYNCGANDQARVDRLESLADDQKHLVRASFAGSGALLLSGVLLLLLAPTERSTAVAVRPVVGLDVIGARLCGRL
jgi:hypothetical protein